MPDRSHDEMNRRIAEFMGHEPKRRYTVTDDGGQSSVYTSDSREQSQRWLNDMRRGGLLTDKYEVGLWEFWPAYTSDDLPRSLLAGVEQKLQDLGVATSSNPKDHPWLVYVLHLSDIVGIGRDKELYGVVEHFRLLTAPAEARCRAIRAVLDEMEAGNGSNA